MCSRRRRTTRERSPLRTQRLRNTVNPPVASAASASFVKALRGRSCSERRVGQGGSPALWGIISAREDPQDVASCLGPLLVDGSAPWAARYRVCARGILLARRDA